MSASLAMLQQHGAPQEPVGDGHSGVFDLGEMLARHILNASEYELPFVGAVHLPKWDSVHVAGLSVDMSPSKHVVLLLLAAVITAAMTLFAARTVVRQGSGTAPGGAGQRGRGRRGLPPGRPVQGVHRQGIRALRAPSSSRSSSSSSR